MTGTIVYGSELSLERKGILKEKVEALVSTGKRIPCLAVILVGNNPASLSYVKGKEKGCAQVGMTSRFFHLEEDASQEELEKVIIQCNEDPEIDGILVQLPLPKGLDEKKAIDTISPDKDVDGLHRINVGRMYLKEKGFIPCTPKGIMALLEKMGCEIDGKRAAVVGRSRLVGEPVAKLLQDKNATVTICHSHTKDLPAVCREADILIAAIGRAKMIDHTYVKEGAYVVDVGINRDETGHLVGDVDFDDVREHTTAITPVPKGVGPMTICMLLENTFQAYEDKMK